jgi:hypothetical protein
MRNLAKSCVVIGICFGMTGSGWAGTHPRSTGPRAGQPKPMAAVWVPSKPLCFGEVSGPGPRKLKAELTARVVANCPFRLRAAFQGFTVGASKLLAIPPQQLTVTINGKDVPIGTNYVEIAAGGPTPKAGVNAPVVVEIVVKDSSSHPAGRYGGSLALSVIPGL